LPEKVVTLGFTLSGFGYKLDASYPVNLPTSGHSNPKGLMHVHQYQ
jgi:hypothetical protein